MSKTLDKVRFSIRISKEENFFLKEAAIKLSKSKNFILRFLIKTHLKESTKILDRINRLEKIYQNIGFQIKKIGNNLNQININYYQNKSVKIQRVEKELEDLWQSIKQSKEFLNTLQD